MLYECIHFKFYSCNVNDVLDAMFMYIVYGIGMQGLDAILMHLLNVTFTQYSMLY